MKPRPRERIRVAIAGIGNCASALVQGIAYCRRKTPELAFKKIGEYQAGDIDIVAAFDVDERKVGHRLETAIFAKPNCAAVFHRDVIPFDVTVKMGPVMDGVAKHMMDYGENESIRLSSCEPVDVASELRQSNADVLVCYLPVGSENAVKAYAIACLSAGVSMINCVPVFLASSCEWADKFKKAGLSIIGDDIKSQVGATIVHRALVSLLHSRGIKIQNMYQLNIGGNTDFLNMLDLSRLESKRTSKTQSVLSRTSQEIPSENVHIGPSDYVRWQRDNKIAFIRLEGVGFGGLPFNADLRLSVQDSPNSAAIVIDGIRLLAASVKRGQSGALLEASAYCMKSPPKEMSDEEAYQAIRSLVTLFS